MHLNSLLDGFLGVFFFTKCLKTSKKRRGWLTQTIKFGETLNRICFGLISYFFSPWFQFQLQHWVPSNLGKRCICFAHRFIFVTSVCITFQQNNSWIGESQCMYCYLCPIFEFWSQNECMIFSNSHHHHNHHQDFTTLCYSLFWIHFSFFNLAIRYEIYWTSCIS